MPKSTKYSVVSPEIFSVRLWFENHFLSTRLTGGRGLPFL
jgi:hypothetical protein